MEGEIIIGLLEKLWSGAGVAFMYLGILVVSLRAIVKITPTGKDDALLAKLDAIPILGSFLSGVASRSPVKKS